LLYSEHYRAASDKTEQALTGAARGSPWYWKLRLQRAEILLARRETQQAASALDFQIPAGAQWTEDRARYSFCQANAFFFQQKYPEAASKLDQAHSLARTAGAARLLAEIELRRGSLAAVQKRPDDAASSFHSVAAYADHNADPYLQLGASGNMGFLFLRSFRYEEAIPWFERALAGARRLGATDSEGRALGNLGWCYYRLADTDKAMRYFRDADNRSGAAGNRSDQQLWLGHMGSIFLDRYEYGPAAEQYQQALKVARELNHQESIGTWLDNLASVSIETGDWAAAERYNQEAGDLWRRLGAKSEEMYSIANAGRIAAGGRDFVRAEKLFRSVIAEARDPVPLMDASSGLAHAFVAAGRDKEAEAQFLATEAIVERQRSELVEDEHKLTYFSSMIEFSREYVEFLMSRGRKETALEVAESSRARLLADKLQLSHSPASRRTAADFRKIAARSHGVLLSYWLAPKKSYLWVITPSVIAAFPLAGESEIRSLVEAYDALVEDGRDPLVTQNATGQKLFDALLKPALPLLSKTTNVILVPDGPLYSLNFETLPVLAGTPHYWLQDAAISITPSLGLLTAKRARPGRSANALLLIGNPVSPVAQYPALMYASQEMAAIEKSLPDFQKVVMEGAQARPDTYAKSDPGRFTLIHFVAHAAANREDPLDSAVILSRDGANFKLRAKDVLHTPLHADLVTISACRSAGARTYAGEGLVGFSWAFLQAGAGHVIAGLWDVNDRSTAELMAGLYAGIARGLGPAEALRAAKLQLAASRDAYRKPYYWAPFQVFTASPD
jgi:CHAT domain-containing protein